MMLFEHRVFHPDVPDRENKAGKSQIYANNLEVYHKSYSDFCVLLQTLVFFRFLQFLISWPFKPQFFLNGAPKSSKSLWDFSLLLFFTTIVTTKPLILSILE